MAIIYSYPKKITPADGDFLVITDSEQPAPNKNRTKSLTLGDLSTFVLSSQTTYDLTGAADLNDYKIVLTGSDGTVDNVFFEAGTGITLADQGTNTVQIQATNNGTVTGTGTPSTLTMWNAAGTGIEDSKIKYVPADDKIIVGLNSANFEFFTAGRFKTNFIECTQDTRSDFTGSIRTKKKLEVGFTSGAGQASLDVQADSNGKAAVFRGGVIIAPGNISDIQVDNSSLVVGSGQNDIISGSDHCAVIGNGNQIQSDSDNSLAVGLQNTIKNDADNCFAIGVQNSIDGTGVATGQSVKSQLLGFGNSLKGSYSSFIAGGQNHVEVGNNAMVLGYNNGTDAIPILGADAVFALGAGNQYASRTGQNVFMLGNSLTGSSGTFNIGFRNNTTEYPATNFTQGLGETKVVISTGTTTTTNSNAIVITEGGVTRGGGTQQIPRIILPTVTSFEYANGTLAKAAGIPVGGLFHTAGVLKIVLSTD